MSEASEFFEQLTGKIPNATAGKMFGALCIKMPNGKAGAMFWEDNLVVKLKKDELEKALSLNGAKLFEPMAGRPMKEWVQVPYEHRKKWKALAEASAAAAELVPKKMPKKKK